MRRKSLLGGAAVAFCLCAEVVCFCSAQSGRGQARCLAQKIPKSIISGSTLDNDGIGGYIPCGVKDAGTRTTEPETSAGQQGKTLSKARTRCDMSKYFTELERADVSEPDAANMVDMKRTFQNFDSFTLPNLGA